MEGYFALVWLMILWFRSRGGEPARLPFLTWWRWGLLLTAVLFLPYLSFPFLADDYPHILHAHALAWSGIPALFTVPAPDRFFRPLGYISYALDSHWAGISPTLWRLAELAFHLANAVLIYLLCRELRFPALPALFGALLFAVHGSRPEAVTWVSARFDLLAVFFGLSTLLFVLRGNQVAAGLFLLAGVLSKESAFVVPLLAIAVLWYAGRRIVRPVAPLFGIAAAVFAYRWFLLGGVGGYRNVLTGAPTVFDFKLTSTLQALFPRFWGAMLFPINWSTFPGAFLLLSFALCVLSLLWLATGRASRRPTVLGLVFAYICALPVHQFLSIGADLEKSRVLYFASVGLAMIFAASITSRTLLIPAACVLLFQCAALEHNLAIWKRVGYQARQACVEGALDLPNVVNGVYFLHTGYPECLNFPK